MKCAGLLLLIAIFGKRNNNNFILLQRVHKNTLDGISEIYLYT